MALLMDIAMLGDTIVEKKEQEKINKYQDLVQELKRLWKVETRVILNTIEHLLHSLNLDDVTVSSVIRLGKRPESSDAKPRPIKIVMASEEQKIRVLSKSKNLPRQREGASTNIFMHQDLTPRQRMRRQDLVKELKDRQAKGEKNLMIVNLRIVERRGPKSQTVS